MGTAEIAAERRAMLEGRGPAWLAASRVEPQHGCVVGLASEILESCASVPARSRCVDRAYESVVLQTSDRAARLRIAGALIASEIDRIRQEQEEAERAERRSLSRFVETFVQEVRS